MAAIEFEDQLIGLIKKKFQNGEFEGEMPSHWTEDDAAEYMINKLRLRKAYRSTGREGSLIRDEEDAPLWAQKLMGVLETVEKVIVPTIMRMNEERLKEVEEQARRVRLFNSQFETEEERTLLAEEERKKPKPEAYPLEPKEQFHDYTKDNIVGGPGGVMPGPETYPKPEAYPYAENYPYGLEKYGGTEQKTKRKSDSNLTMSSGTRRKEELRRAEEHGPVQVGSEELKRKLFNQLIDAQKRENEALEVEREIKSLPTRITDLAKRLSKIPFGRWTVQDMSNAVKYFTADQVSQIVKVSEERNGSI